MLGVKRGEERRERGGGVSWVVNRQCKGKRGKIGRLRMRGGKRKMEGRGGDVEGREAWSSRKEVGEVGEGGKEYGRLGGRRCV
jgi:hypothetical protein